jgi:hypothetical protein
MAPLAPGWVFDMLEQNMAFVVAFVVLAHVIVLGAVCGSLWKQSPKQERMNRRFGDVEGKQA